MADIDALLDDALNDFDENLTKKDLNKQEPSQLQQPLQQQERKDFAKELEELAKNPQLSEFSDFLKEMPPELKEVFDKISADPSANEKPATDPFDAAVRMLSEGAQKLTSPAEGGSDEEMNDLINKLMKEFADDSNDPAASSLFGSISGSSQSNSSGEEDPMIDAMVSKMMNSMLGKDIMYAPIKQLAEKFAPWLEQNRTKLPDSEYLNYVEQHKCFVKLTEAYESDADSKIIFDLMQQMQAFGNPPRELISDLMPSEVEFDENGLPKLPSQMESMALRTLLGGSTENPSSDFMSSMLGGAASNNNQKPGEECVIM